MTWLPDYLSFMLHDHDYGSYSNELSNDYPSYLDDFTKFIRTYFKLTENQGFLSE